MGLWGYLLCGLRGRGQRGTSALSAAGAIEVQRMESGGWARPPTGVPAPLFSVSAIVEPLERRLQLTATFDCFMSASVSGRNVTVVLWNTGAQASQFTVNWNDPNGSASLTYNANADGSPLTKTYTYGGAFTGTITASAKTSAGATSTTAYYALGGSFGNFQGVQGTGASTRIPNGNTGSVGQTAMAIDNVSGDHFQGELFVAHSYYPSGGGGPLIGITAFNAPGQPAAGQFDSTWGNYNGSANNGTYVVPSFGNGGDVPYGIAIANDSTNSRTLVVVVGKCALGWAIVAVDTSQNATTHNYGVPGWKVPSASTAFEGGYANGVGIGEFVSGVGTNVYVVGTNANKMVAAALNLANGAILSNWGDNNTGIVTVPYKNPGIDNFETGYAVFAETAVFATNNEDLVVGGYTNWCCGTSSGSDFTLVKINDDNGTVDTTIRTNIGNTIPCGCSASYDQAFALVPWQNPGVNGNPEVTLVGKTTATGRTTVGLTHYDLQTNALVTTFGHHGAATGPAGTGQAGALLDSTGEFVVSGSSGNDIMTERYTVAGVLDTAAGSTFGNAGIMYQDFGDLSSNSVDTGWSVLIGADGSILVGGSTLPNGSSNNQIALADYFASNQLVIT